ncbi:MAG: gene transfer agent family protein [Alsobacter sp.]
MSRTAEISLVWADGPHTFRLGIKQLRELQEKCADRIRQRERGPKEILEALFMGSWLVDDVIQTIRLGLIGGGMDPAKAYTLVENYVEGRPLSENVMTAVAIIGAAMVGPAEDEIEGPPGGDGGKPTPATAGSTSQSSTEPAPRSAGPRARSTTSRSGSSRRR